MVVTVKVYFLLLLLFWWVQHSEVDARVAAKPNILMFVIDDLGWNDTSYQGSEIPTPTIDKFAKNGIRLKQYYVQSVCSPTRAAIMTGRYPYHMGLARAVISNGRPFALPLNQPTIANELKKGGYATHYVGKWNLGMHKWEYTPTYRGFDSFYGFYNGDADHFTHFSAAVGNDKKRTFFGLDLRNNTVPVVDKNGVYSTNLFTEAIMEAINKHASDKVPFFIYAAYQSVRAPLQAPQKYLDQCQFIPFEKRRQFCALLIATDEGIANITTLLKEKNMLEDTIIIFTTDNGGQAEQGSSNWPLRGNKDTVFEGGVRGTAYVWGANLPKSNYDNNQLIHATDWLPTIVEGIAGLELNKEKWPLDGYNVWPTITNNFETPHQEILINLDPARPGFVGQAAIRSGDWKLIIGRPNCTYGNDEILFPCPDGWSQVDGSRELPPYTPSLTWLFNIKTDPNERNNVAELYPEKVLELKERIEYYNATHIEQLHPPLDPKSNPLLFGVKEGIEYYNATHIEQFDPLFDPRSNLGAVWTPWLD